MLCKLRFDFGVDTKVAEGIRKQPADEKFGAKVVELHRLTMGNLHLPDDLAVGECRELTEEERIAAISAMVPDRREKLVAAGVEAANARRMAAELAVAEAKNGEENLSLIQKTRILTDLADSNDEALAAVSTVLQEATYGKLEVADAYGVTVADWVQYREAWSKTYGEDSVSQDKVRNVLDRMHLTNRQKAVPKNNPYDTGVGEDVYYELSEE